jgi:hypothetical protein
MFQAESSGGTIESYMQVSTLLKKNSTERRARAACRKAAKHLACRGGSLRYRVCKRLQAFFNEARSFHGLWLVFSVVAACLVFRIRGRGLLAECRCSGEFAKFFL